ncbi:hypothetical protein PYW07_012408 [Mythimna separata]|uniref:Single domain-containing protein n=1 Tax=Mythimna separata TaxID=271217 RepID=A0AAD7YM65_MYTSE|nr:hypothetical protein PYW07_012408 [Mythimna separata]
MLSNIIILAFVVGTATAAVSFEELPKKPCELAHKEGCYVKMIDDVIPYGSTRDPLGTCVRIQCSTSGIQYMTCGVADTDDENCYITDIDVSKPYPDCCPDIECYLDNNWF